MINIITYFFILIMVIRLYILTVKHSVDGIVGFNFSSSDSVHIALSVIFMGIVFRFFGFYGLLHATIAVILGNEIHFKL